MGCQMLRGPDVDGSRRLLLDSKPPRPPSGEVTEAALNIASRLSRDENWELVKREIRTATARPSRSTATLADSALKILVHIDRRGSPAVGVGTQPWPPQPPEAVHSGVGYQNEVPPPNLNCCTISYFPLVSGIAWRSERRPRE